MLKRVTTGNKSQYISEDGWTDGTLSGIDSGPDVRLCPHRSMSGIQLESPRKHSDESRNVLIIQSEVSVLSGVNLWSEVVVGRYM